MSFQPAKDENNCDLCHSHFTLKTQSQTLCCSKKIQNRVILLGPSRPGCLVFVNKTKQYLSPLLQSIPLIYSLPSQTHSQTPLLIFHVLFSVHMKKRLMAPSRKDLKGLKIVVLVTLFFSLTFFPYKTGKTGR